MSAPRPLRIVYSTYVAPQRELRTIECSAEHTLQVLADLVLERDAFGVLGRR